MTSAGSGDQTAEDPESFISMWWAYLLISLTAFVYFIRQHRSHQQVCADLLPLSAPFVCWHCRKACVVGGVEGGALNLL